MAPTQWAHAHPRRPRASPANRDASAGRRRNAPRALGSPGRRSTRPAGGSKPRVYSDAISDRTTRSSTSSSMRNTDLNPRRPDPAPPTPPAMGSPAQRGSGQSHRSGPTGRPRAGHTGALGHDRGTDIVARHRLDARPAGPTPYRVQREPAARAVVGGDPVAAPPPHDCRPSRSSGDRGAGDDADAPWVLGCRGTHTDAPGRSRIRGFPRVTTGQANAGKPVADPALLLPGDLILIPGSEGTTNNPRHVGMHLGEELIIQGPKTGDVVKTTRLGSWINQIAAIRRIVS